MGSLMKFQIVSDSGCDLPVGIVSDADVHYELVPLMLHVGDEVIIDDESLDIDALLNTIKGTKGHSSTACPSPETYAEHFRQADNSFAVTISAELSGSYQSAMIAREMVLAEFPDKKIHVVNSLSVCAGQSLLVLKLKELMQDTQNNFESIMEKIESYRKSLSLYFLIHSFESLIKAGRMSRIAGVVASALAIHPICGDNGEGKIKIYEKVRGTKTAVLRMVEMVGKRAPTEDRRLIIAHCNNAEGADTIKELAERMYKFAEILIFPMRGLSTFYAGDQGLIIAW